MSYNIVDQTQNCYSLTCSWLRLCSDDNLPLKSTMGSRGNCR